MSAIPMINDFKKAPKYATDDRALYDRRYFDEREYAIDKKRQIAYEQELARLQTFYLGNHDHIGGNVLDIGCGVGSFLVCMDDRWHKYGYEPSDFAAEQASKKGIEMVRALNTVQLGTMDLVIFRGTLQHIADPITSLFWATKILRPGGVLAILATPDADSLVYQIWGRLPALDMPRNWIVMGSRNLRNILEARFEYSNVECSFPYLGGPYARPVHDFCNFGLSLLFGWRKFAFPGSMFEIMAVK